MRNIYPKKAVILAAGFGTRMQPLSGQKPKPLMPIWNKPVLQHLLELLRDWQVEEVLINVHHKPEQLISFFKMHAFPGLHINLSFEPDILGTGGPLRRAAWFLDDQPFWMANADVLADLDPRPILKAFHQKPSLAALWMHPEKGPRSVELRADGRVKTFRSAHPGNPKTFTFCGLQLLHPDILKFMPQAEGFYSIIDAYESAMQKRKRVVGVPIKDAYWADMGSPEKYIEVHREIFEAQKTQTRGARLYTKCIQPPGMKITGFAALAPDIQALEGAQVHDSIVWNGAVLGRKSRLHSAIAASDTRINGACDFLALPAKEALTTAEKLASAKSGFEPARSTCIFLPARASDRSFIRIGQGAKSMMLIRYQTEREENALYAEHARFLKRLGVRVPSIMIDRPAEKFILMEDVGDRTLTEAPTLKNYQQLLVGISQMHQTGLNQAREKGLKLMPGFTTDLFAWEHRLFLDQFTTLFDYATPSRCKRMLKELRAIADRLGKTPFVLLHRDLQSSNVLLWKKETVLIDFQGMRPGPAAYDLASLLYDPYVSLPEKTQSDLSLYYRERNPDLMEDEDLLHWAAIQRLAQALGAYGRMSLLPGCERFKAHFIPGLNMLDRALARTSEFEGLAAFVKYGLEALDSSA